MQRVRQRQIILVNDIYDVSFSSSVMFGHFWGDTATVVGLFDYQHGVSYECCIVAIALNRAVFGRPFVKLFILCYRSVVCLSVCSDYNVNGAVSSSFI